MLQIVKALDAAGYEVYFVGGYVRDRLMGRTPKDIDLTTNARPDDVLRVAREAGLHAFPFGAYGTVKVLEGDEEVEITTYRKDAAYSDGRRPDSVTFSESIYEDLARRDLTVCAIAQNALTGEYVDPYDGRGDIERKLLRAVRDPIARMATGEDADGLRAFRVLRFLAEFGSEWVAEQDTFRALADPRVHEKASRVAPERIRVEMMKALVGEDPDEFFAAARSTGLLDLVLPELEPTVGMMQNPKYHAYSVWTHIMHVVRGVPSDKPLLRLAALLHDIAKPVTRSGTYPDFHFYEHEKVGVEMAETIMHRLAFSNDDIAYVTTLVREHMLQPDIGKPAIRRLLARLGDVPVTDLIDLRRADFLAHGTAAGEDAAHRLLTDFAFNVLMVRSEKPATKLAISGHDVMALGVPEGREVGRVLKALREAVFEDPTKNERESLLAEARRLV